LKGHLFASLTDLFYTISINKIQIDQH